MNSIHIREAIGKGRGVFACRKLTPKDSVYSISGLPVSAISTSQLSSFCYHCYGCSLYEEQNWYSIGQARNADLKVCAGCKVAYFCGKECQSQAWKRYHKFECKIYMNLHPKILPESIRAIVRFALQHRNGKLAEGIWQAVLSLKSHVKELEAAGGDNWMNLMLMAKAAAEYSKASDETTLLHLLCILKINAMTLQTTANDTIGLFLDPLLATLNHSCDANIAVHRPMYTNSVGWQQRKPAGQVMLVVMPLREILPDEELTVTYIDFQEHVDKRQAKLKQDYFFTCTCPKCSADLDLESSLQKSDPGFAELWSSWRSKADAQVRILSSPPFTTDVLAKSVTELTDLSTEMEADARFSAKMDPYSRATQELKLLHMSEQKSCDRALIQAFKQHLVIGPQLYSSEIHPTRVINAIYLLQILGLLDETFQSSHNNGSNIESHRQAVEQRGLSRQSFTYWRGRIGADMRELLQNTVAADLAQCFEIELLSSGLERVQEMRRLYDDSSVKKRAEADMQKLLSITDERWSEIKKSWKSAPQAS